MWEMFFSWLKMFVFFTPEDRGKRSNLTCASFSKCAVFSRNDIKTRCPLDLLLPASIPVANEGLGWDFPILKMVHVILVSDDWILEGWTLQVNSYCYRNIGSCNLSLARRFADSRWRTGVTFWGDYQWLSDGWSRSVLFKLNHKLIRALEVLHSESFFPWKYAYMAPKKGSRIIIFQASRLLGENSLNNFGGYELKKSS